MRDAVELMLGTLAVALCGATLALTWQLVREAWRGAAHARRGKAEPGSAVTREGTARPAGTADSGLGPPSGG